MCVCVWVCVCVCVCVFVCVCLFVFVLRNAKVQDRFCGNTRMLAHIPELVDGHPSIFSFGETCKPC